MNIISRIAAGIVDKQPRKKVRAIRRLGSGRNLSWRRKNHSQKGPGDNETRIRVSIPRMLALFPNDYRVANQVMQTSFVAPECDHNEAES